MGDEELREKMFGRIPHNRREDMTGSWNEQPPTPGYFGKTRSSFTQEDLSGHEQDNPVARTADEIWHLFERYGHSSRAHTEVEMALETALKAQRYKGMMSPTGQKNRSQNHSAQEASESPIDNDPRQGEEIMRLTGMLAAAQRHNGELTRELRVAEEKIGSANTTIRDANARIEELKDQLADARRRQTPQPDAYGILGIDPERFRALSSAERREQITKMRRLYGQMYHPDTSGPIDPERLKKINNALDTLSSRNS